MIYNNLTNCFPRLLGSLGVFIFFAGTFILPSGYSYGAALLLLLGLVYIFHRRNFHITLEDKFLLWALIAVFGVAISSFLIHGNQPKTLDQGTRYLLFIPILLFMLRIPPNPRALWAGLSFGVLSALALALWQRYILGIPRPDGFMTSAIPFGNLALMAGILCLTGIRWTTNQSRYVWLWKIGLFISFMAGLYVSLLSGSRGGWLAVPAILVIFAATFWKKNEIKPIAISTLVLLAALVIAAVTMREEIITRYDTAVAEINDYVVNGNATTSVGLRLEAWRTAIRSIIEKPILGWSYRDYDIHLGQLVAEKEAVISVTTLANTHNNFLEVWLHQGLFGFLAFLALFIVPFWFFCKRLRSDDHTVQAFALGGACLLACFFVFSLTQVILGRNNGVIFFGLSLVIFWGCMRNAEQRTAATAAGQ